MSSDRTGVAGILVDGGQDGAGLYVRLAYYHYKMTRLIRFSLK